MSTLLTTFTLSNIAIAAGCLYAVMFGMPLQSNRNGGVIHDGSDA